MKQHCIRPLVIACLSLAASGAYAVELSHDGRGDLLLYPFYSAENGNDTYISVTNNTDQAKALRVRFREALANAEVLGFNLYLGPRDHWSGAITTQGEGARLVSPDASCTYPAQPEGGFVFSDERFMNDPVFTGSSIERTREGFVEIIEMGTLDDEETHSSKGPFGAVKGIFGEGISGDRLDNGMLEMSPAPILKGCNIILAAWTTGFAFDDDPTRNIGPATGGLSGHGVVINVSEGTNITYNAQALKNFFDGGFLHSHPEDASPSLADAAPVARIYHEQHGLITLELDEGLDAVNSVLTRSEISNDLVTAPEINASTEWVINFPTLHHYRDNEGSESLDTPYPAGALKMTVYDRQGDSSYGQDFSVIDFAVGARGDHGIFPYGAINVLSFNPSQPILHASSGTKRPITLKEGVINGHAVLSLRDSNIMLGAEYRDNKTSYDTPQGTLTLTGAPIIGFAVQKYVNGQVNGVLSNYTGTLNYHSSLDMDIQQD